MQSTWLGKAVPLGILFAVAIFAFSPLLLGGKASFGEEQIGFYSPLAFFTQQALLNNTSLVWSGNYGGGVVMTSDQFASAWNPLTRALLFLIPSLSFFEIQHFGMLIATTLGLWCAYWFGRLQGWHIASSIALATGYASATTFQWLQIGTLPSVAFLVCPALLVALWYAAHGQATRVYIAAVIFGGVIFGFGFLAGFMQFIIYNSAVAALYALFLDWSLYIRERAWYRNAATSLGYVAMAFIGLIVGFKQWFPSTFLLEYSIRTDTFAIQHATVPRVTELIGLFFPPYFSIPFFGGGGAEGLYIGALGLVGAVLVLIYYRSHTSLFFTGAYVIVAAFAFHVPGFSWLNEHIPPFSHMSGNFRWLAAGALPLAFLGAAGIEGLLRTTQAVPLKAHRIIWYVLGGLILIFSLGSAALSVAVNYITSSPALLVRAIEWYAGGRVLTHAPDYYVVVLSEEMRKVAGMFSFSNPKFLFGIGCWIFAFGTLALLTSSYRRYAPHAVIAVSIITFCGTVFLQWDTLVPQKIYTSEPELVTFLKSRGENSHEYRILPFIVGDGLFNQFLWNRPLTPEEATFVQRDTLVGSASQFYDVQMMSGFRPLYTLRMNQLLSTVVAYETEHYIFDDVNPALATSALDKVYNRDVQKKVELDEKMKDLTKRLPLISMMNVKYIYSPYQLSSSSLSLIETIHIPVAQGLPLYIYENRAVLPRVYMAGDVRFTSGTNTQVLLHVIGTDDFKTETWIECSDCLTREAGAGTATIANYEDGKIEIKTDIQKDGWLVLSESYSPGWRVTIDGAESTVYAANFLFQAVRVPAGNHTVAFTYTDPGLPEIVRILDSLVSE